MSKIIEILPNNLIKIKKYKSPNAVFNTDKYSSHEEMCVLNEIIEPFSMYFENQQLKSVLKEIREYINKMEFDEYGVLYDNGKNLFEYEPNFKDKALEIMDKGIKEDE